MNEGPYDGRNLFGGCYKFKMIAVGKDLQFTSGSRNGTTLKLKLLHHIAIICAGAYQQPPLDLAGLHFGPSPHPEQSPTVHFSRGLVEAGFPRLRFPTPFPWMQDEALL